MRIIYVISNINNKNKGNGGHYYSLLTTAEEVSKTYNVHIINIGVNPSIALSTTNLNVINITNTKANTLSLISVLNKAVGTLSPDVIHVFDEVAYFYSRIVCFLRKVPIILTKCGGPNPSSYYPFSEQLIIYSEEDNKYFHKAQKFKNTKVYLIPNRIVPYKDDKYRIDKLKRKHNLHNADLIFLRISRIGEVYKKSILQLNSVLSESIKRGINAVGIVLGTVEDESVLHEIMEEACSKLIIECDPFYTTNAKELVAIADVVLGSGRGFMEAAIKDKIMLSPCSNQSFPVLVNENNFKDVFALNFSQRFEVESGENQVFINEIISLIRDKNLSSEYLNKMSRIFHDNFLLSSVLDDYHMIYSSIKPIKRLRLLDLILNYILVIRRYHSNYK